MILTPPTTSLSSSFYCIDTNLKFEKNREMRSVALTVLNLNATLLMSVALRSCADKFIGKYITSQSLNKFQKSNCNGEWLCLLRGCKKSIKSNTFKLVPDKIF